MADRYQTPEQGTLDWHVPLNENFTALSRDVELRDVEANLGKYSPRSGAKFLATDTRTIYIGDGSTWVPTGSILQADTFTTQMTTYGGGLAEYELFRLPGDGVQFHFNSLSAAMLGGGSVDSSVTCRVYAESTGTTPVATVNGNEAAYGVDTTFQAGEDIVMTLDTSGASSDVTLAHSLQYERR
jgi:hypothetical protein